MPIREIGGQKSASAHVRAEAEFHFFMNAPSLSVSVRNPIKIPTYGRKPLEFRSADRYIAIVKLLSTKRKGAQIDLVIKRADKVIHLVEMKFSETPFVITKDYEQRLKERKNLFMEVNKLQRGPVHTFITPMGIARGIHASFVHSQLTAKDLFATLPIQL